MTKEIIYIGDPMCSWCYAFSPVIQRLFEKHKDESKMSLVLGGLRSEALDSARSILARDIDYSDEFEVIALPTGDSVTLAILGDGAGPDLSQFVNYGLYSALGADYAVDARVENTLRPILRFDTAVANGWDARDDGVLVEEALPVNEICPL